MQDLELALIQTSLVWEDVAANRTHFEKLLVRAEGADLIILPEAFTTSFSMNSLALAEPEEGPTIRWMQDWAVKLEAVVTGSLIIQARDGTFRNRLVWAQPDGNLTHYDKRHLFRMAGEHERYAPGDRQLLVHCKEWNIRPLVCYDLRFPVWSRDPHHTHLLFYVANWPSPRRNQWNRLLPARAIENLCYVAGVNRIGTDAKDNAYSGDSQILDYQGDTLINAGAEDGVFRATLSAAGLAAWRKKFPAWQDADSFVIKEQSPDV